MTNTFVENWLACGRSGLSIEVRRKLRVLNWAAATLAAVLLCWVGINVWYGAWPLVFWLAGLALLVLGLLVLLRRSLAVALVGHLTCLVLVVTLAVSSYYSGGFTGPNLSLLLVVPVGAVTVVGPRGLWWGLPTVGLVIALVVAQNHGWVFPFLTPEAQRPLDGFLTWLTSIGVITFLISRYEVARRRAERDSLDALYRAEAASQVRTRFISWISRELRVPAHALLGYIDVVEREQDATARRRQVAQARGAGRLLAALVDNVLELAREESRQAGPGQEAFSLRQVVQRIAGSLAGQMEGWGLRLEVDLAEEIPEVLSGDVATLERLLLNMLYYLGERGRDGALCICARPLRLGKNDARLQFEIYLRSRSTPRPDNQSSRQRLLAENGDQQDINITLARQLVDWLGGSMMQLDREQERFGFRFLVEFGVAGRVRWDPHRDNGVAATVPGGRQPGPRQPEEEHPLVLVADDNQVNRRLARRLLEGLGCRVLEAADGQQAVELASGHDFALLLLDDQMPRLDGRQAAVQIRRREKEQGGHLPIVVVTAHGDSERRSQYREAGMDDYLAKPFSRRDMERLLQKWLRRPAGASRPDAPGPGGPPGGGENSPPGDH